MAVSKKDFEAIAKVIKQERDTAIEHDQHGARMGISAVAFGVAAHFAQENPRFDRDRFLAACGIPT